MKINPDKASGTPAEQYIESLKRRLADADAAIIAAHKEYDDTLRRLHSARMSWEPGYRKAVKSFIKTP